MNLLKYSYLDNNSPKLTKISVTIWTLASSCIIYTALKTACVELNYDVDVTWEAGARQPLFRVTNEEGDAHASGVLFMNKLCNNVHRWARCALQHGCCCTCHMPATWVLLASATPQLQLAPSRTPHWPMS